MRLALLLPLLCLAACAPAPPPAEPFDERAGADARRIEADVRFLADDLLEGREAGTRGFDLAALYVAQRMRAIGVRPAGDARGYFQTVPLLRGTRVEEGSRLVVTRDGATTALRYREQFLPALNYNAPDSEITAPAVFVGQAVHAPELKQDDFTGIDVRGKIAVLFAGAPARFDNDRRAFYSSTREKLATLESRGAVGVVFVATDEEEARRPWTRSAENWNKPGMRLRREASPLLGRREASPLGGRHPDNGVIDGFPQLKVVASVHSASADVLLATEGRSASQLFAQAKAGTLRGFDLPGTITLSARTAIAPATSRNVVGVLPGRGALAKEHVVFTAHLDHVGIGAPVNGDAIYNGALDNALGVAVMLEAAQHMATQAERPQRSILIVAVTAEEKGLLGAEWFAQHPTVARGSLVANVNMDMPVLLVPTRDIVPIGVEHSTLKGVVEQAAREVGLALTPDPLPEETVFVRSDQYAFVRAGIPAVKLNGGVRSARLNRDAAAPTRSFLKDHYHQPGDDANQPIQYADAARLARLNARIGTLIANTTDRPKWNDGDFFGVKFAPPVK